MLDEIHSFFEFSNEMADTESVRLLFSRLYLQVVLNMNVKNIQITNAELNTLLFDDVKDYIYERLEQFRLKKAQ